MIIETVNLPEEKEIKLKDLSPGTVFQFSDCFEQKPGPIMLKLNKGLVVLLTYAAGVECFELYDGSMSNRKIVKVWGKLVGLKVQL